MELGTLEIQSTRIKAGGKFYTITNVYTPTYRTRNTLRSMLRNLGVSLATLNRKFSSDTHIVIGDFNMPKMKWVYLDENQNYLSNVTTTLSENEKLFLHIFSSFGLMQINSRPNPQGVFLDLVFTNDTMNVSTRSAEAHEQFDNDSHHHKAIIIECESSMNIQQQVVIDLNKIHLRQTRQKLNELSIISPTEHDIAEALEQRGRSLQGKIESFVRAIKNIQCCLHN